VRQPTLAIFGRYSSCLRTLRGLEENLPNCRKVIVPAVGHFHPVFAPETFVQKLRQFITGAADESQ
jgi:pimeloyl-ACP methyl ester carboxylesterase